jgi:hypothetical protein
MPPRSASVENNGNKNQCDKTSKRLADFDQCMESNVVANRSLFMTFGASGFDGHAVSNNLNREYGKMENNP